MLPRRRYASSSSIYGMNKKIPFSEDDQADMPASLYGASKKANENIAYAYNHIYNIRSIGLRFFTVYGPYGRPDMAYFEFADKIRNGENITVYYLPDGDKQIEPVRDFTYVDDIVK